MTLLRKPRWGDKKLHEITRQNAGWGYVGFGLYRLDADDEISELTGDTEVIVVLVEGRARIRTDAQDFGILGTRMSVFEKTPPDSVYIPHQSRWHAAAVTQCTVAVCHAPCVGGHAASVLPAPQAVTRGTGANTRMIYPIAMEESDVADHLLVTEVFTPSGNWSSYPPHRHDADNYPDMTYLEETYYHRLNPEQGFAFQRVFTEDGTLDETMAVGNHDVVLVPRGHHPCAAPYGYELYYLNVMAGPLRKWRYQNHPDHAWIAARDAPASASATQEIQTAKG